MIDLYETSGLSSIIYKQEELKLFYARKNFEFRSELFDILQVWLTLMLKHLKTEAGKTKAAPTPEIIGSRPPSKPGVGSR